MDFLKRAPPQGSPRRSPKAARLRAMEADENGSAGIPSPMHTMATGSASPQKKKVLGERNSDDGGTGAASPPQGKPAPSPPSLTGRGVGTYDPKTNYTTPRPEFLRYNPERRREILLRLEREVVEDEASSATSATAASEAVSPGASSRGSDSECDEVDDGEPEEEEVVPRRGGWARRLFLLLTALACLVCYICCMNSAPFPASSPETLDLAGPNGTIYDITVRQVDFGEAFAPIDMMSSKDMIQEAAGQIGHRGSEKVVSLNGSRVSPRNFMAIAMLGLSDVCPNVPYGEFTCQIGDASTEHVDDLKEVNELEVQKSKVINGSLENAEPNKAAYLYGTDSTGSTHTIDLEESKLGSLHQEKGEDYSNHSLMQPVPVEKVMESESEKLNDGKGLESENLDQETEPWEYEINTAEAAKAISAMVKFLWSAMQPHLLQTLISFSGVGFVAAMFKCFQRSRNVPVAVSQNMASVPTAQVPVLPSCQPAQLPVFPSPQAVQLPVFPSQQPALLPVPKQEPSVSLEVPAQSPLPKQDPFLSLEVQVSDPSSRDQKAQHVDADNIGASDSNTVDHKEIVSLKPPVVELLGEFSFVDAGSSEARSTKDSNGNGGEDVVQESSVSLRKAAVKRQKESSTIQSPNVQRARKEEDAEEGEKKMDATPTPLRRSSRLRNRVTSP